MDTKCLIKQVDLFIYLFISFLEIFSSNIEINNCIIIILIQSQTIEIILRKIISNIINNFIKKKTILI